MTFILSVITPGYVAQVSDRRVVTIDRQGQVAVKTDEQNKAVIWNQRLIFAYSGLGDLGPDGRTDLWLAHQLAEIAAEAHEQADADQRFVLDRLADRCTAEFAKPRNAKLDPADRVHTFVAAGWARFEGASEFEPYVGYVSNAMDDAGDYLDTATDTFKLRTKRLGPDDGGYLAQTPRVISAGDMSALIQRAVAVGEMAGGAALIHSLAERVQEAAGTDSLVGRGLMISVLPRQAIEAGNGMIVAAPPSDETATFTYVSSDGATIETYGPIVVSGGMIVTGFVASPIIEQAPDEDAS